RSRLPRLPDHHAASSQVRWMLWSLFRPLRWSAPFVQNSPEHHSSRTLREKALSRGGSLCRTVSLHRARRQLRSQHRVRADFRSLGGLSPGWPCFLAQAWCTPPFFASPLQRRRPALPPQLRPDRFWTSPRRTAVLSGAAACPPAGAKFPCFGGSRRRAPRNPSSRHLASLGAAGVCFSWSPAR